jgi:hypothetical protein
MEPDELLWVFNNLKNVKETGDKVRNALFAYLEKEGVSSLLKVTRNENLIEFFGIQIRMVTEFSIVESPNTPPKIECKLLAHRLKKSVSGETMAPDVIGEIGFHENGAPKGMTFELFPVHFTRGILNHLAKETFTF